MHSKSLMVFNAGPVSYIGELVDQTADQLKLKGVLMGLQRRGSEELEIMAMPFASRASCVAFNLRTTPGMIISEPNTDICVAYDAHLLKAYSNLALV